MVHLGEEAYGRGQDKPHRGKEDGELLNGHQSKTSRWHIQNQPGKGFSAQVLVKLLNCLIVKFETKKWVGFKMTMTVQREKKNNLQPSQTRCTQPEQAFEPGSWLCST